MENRKQPVQFKHLFISHSTKDREIAEKVVEHLENNGVNCWIAPRDISFGTQWAEGIMDGIENASGMMLLFSTHSNKSQMVQREIERAINKGIPVYPLRIEDVEPSKAMEFYISLHQWKDAFAGSLEDSISKLIPDIKLKLGIEVLEEQTNTSYSVEENVTQVKPEYAEGDNIGSYLLGKRLGYGVFGNLFLGTHIYLNIKVAIKILDENYGSDSLIKSRMLLEAKTLQKLKHINIVELKDFFEENGRFVLVTDYIKDVMPITGNNTGPIPYKKALPLFNQILNAVSYVHSKGIVHRDLKPTNVLVDKSNNVKITDFSVAYSHGCEDWDGRAVGTFFYMSPENASGSSVDHRSDIYSLGIILYEMLTGEHPFNKYHFNNQKIIIEHIISIEFPDPREYFAYIPNWLVDIVKKSTAKRPDDRFQSCDEFLEAINTASMIKPEKNAPRAKIIRKENKNRLSINVIKYHIRKYKYLMIAITVMLIAYNGYMKIHRMHGRQEVDHATINQKYPITITIDGSCVKINGDSITTLSARGDHLPALTRELETFPNITSLLSETHLPLRVVKLIVSESIEVFHLYQFVNSCRYANQECSLIEVTSNSGSTLMETSNYVTEAPSDSSLFVILSDDSIRVSNSGNSLTYSISENEILKDDVSEFVAGMNIRFPETEVLAFLATPADSGVSIESFTSVYRTLNQAGIDHIVIMFLPSGQEVNSSIPLPLDSLPIQMQVDIVMEYIVENEDFNIRTNLNQMMIPVNSSIAVLYSDVAFDTVLGSFQEEFWTAMKLTAIGYFISDVDSAILISVTDGIAMFDELPTTYMQINADDEAMYVQLHYNEQILLSQQIINDYATLIDQLDLIQAGQDSFSLSSIPVLLYIDSSAMLGNVIPPLAELQTELDLYEINSYTVMNKIE